MLEIITRYLRKHLSIDYTNSQIEVIASEMMREILIEQQQGVQIPVGLRETYVVQLAPDHIEEDLSETPLD